MMEAAITATGFRCALDTLHCSAVIIRGANNPVYLNPSAKNLFAQCDMDVMEFLAVLKQQINLTYGKGRFTLVAKDITFVCNVYPWIVDERRLGSILVLHKEMHPQCRFMEMEFVAARFHEINAVLEAAYDGMMVTNSLGTIIRLNTAAEKLLMTHRRDLLGRNVRELLCNHVLDDSAVLKVIHSKAPATVIALTKDHKQLLITGTPLFNDDKTLDLVVVNLRDLSELEELKQRLEQKQLIVESYQRELTKLTRQLPDGIVASSPAMMKILAQIDAIAQADATVLITGESGVGKEVIVNRIYTTSSRNHMPLIKINCSAIPPSLFESEMFGYEEGAFTGAKKRGKAGFFEMANGGTLFLDEIGELQIDMQVKLLRVIQEKELTRVGGTKSVHVDVRILAATNQDLWKLTQEGKFRQDLFYRLNVINLEIPPLRERRDDILPLANAFVDKYNAKYHKRKIITLALGKLLRCLEWPGNIRELENLMENLVLMAQEDKLKPCHLPLRYHSYEYEQETGVTVRGILPLKDAMEQTERQLLKNAQERFSNMRDMAAALGVNQSTISRKLQRLNQYNDANVH